MVAKVTFCKAIAAEVLEAREERGSFEQAYVKL